MLLINQVVRRVFKPLVFLFCLLPLGWLVWQAVQQQLGANPIEEVLKLTGDWTLRLLLITLTITPLREITSWQGVNGVRRMLGLFAFFYGVLHVAAYVGLDQFFAWDAIIEDIVERPFITLGLLAFLLLMPLAVTSSGFAMRRLKRRWVGLHRTVYVATTLGVVHFWWAVKSDIRWPTIYAVVLTILLGYRLVRFVSKRARVGVWLRYRHSSGKKRGVSSGP